MLYDYYCEFGEGDIIPHNKKKWIEICKNELLTGDWDFEKFEYYQNILDSDKELHEKIFDKLLIGHKYLLQVKN